LVQNEEARQGGLDISLFKHLSDNHPNSVVYLEHQYRMCEEIMALSNNLIYDGRLKCGSQAVATRCISIPNMRALQHHHFSPSTLSSTQKSICAAATSGGCWIKEMLDPARKVVFLNTDPLLPVSREEARGNRIVNPTESSICTQLVESLITVGVQGTEIGVMTHYRSQLSRLKDGLRNYSDVEMHTTDRFQGRDKEVIILSLVRSNEQRAIGELLKDWRRINVAFTRAKSKLLVIGSRETLLGNGPNTNGEEEMVARFTRLMEERNWIFNLPKTALEDHYFEDGATQTTATAKSHQGTVNHYSDSKALLKVGQERFVGLQDTNGEKENMSISEKRGVLGVSRKQPNKKVIGNKPFKIPAMGVLRDVLNENSY
jgi:DNA replication ATP-dependent helicase Dna2